MWGGEIDRSKPLRLPILRFAYSFLSMPESFSARRGLFQHAGIRREPESLIGNGRKCYHSPRIMATTHPLAYPASPTFEITGKLYPSRSYPRECLKSLLRSLLGCTLLFPTSLACLANRGSDGSNHWWNCRAQDSVNGPTQAPERSAAQGLSQARLPIGRRNPSPK